MDLFTKRTCVFSPCKRYRYRLAVRWRDGGVLNALCLNPSTADAYVSDPTCTRLEIRARAMGYAGLIVTNLFAFRATDPYDMKREADPVGPDNDRHIVEAATESEMCLLAWGNHGRHLGRSNSVRKLLTDAGIVWWTLKLCSNGEPQHPLYQSYDVQPQLGVSPEFASAVKSL